MEDERFHNLRRGRRDIPSGPADAFPYRPNPFQYAGMKELRQENNNTIWNVLNELQSSVLSDKNFHPNTMRRIEEIDEIISSSNKKYEDESGWSLFNPRQIERWNKIKVPYSKKFNQVMSRKEVKKTFISYFPMLNKAIIETEFVRDYPQYVNEMKEEMKFGNMDQPEAEMKIAKKYRLPILSKLQGRSGGGRWTRMLKVAGAVTSTHAGIESKPRYGKKKKKKEEAEE